MTWDEWRDELQRNAKPEHHFRNLTRKEATQMWEEIGNYRLVSYGDGVIVVESGLSQKYPTSDIDLICNVLDDHTMHYAAAERSYNLVYAFSPDTLEEDAASYRKAMLNLGQIDMFEGKSE